MGLERRACVILPLGAQTYILIFDTWNLDEGEWRKWRVVTKDDVAPRFFLLGSFGTFGLLFVLRRPGGPEAEGPAETPCHSRQHCLIGGHGNICKSAMDSSRQILQNFYSVNRSK